MCVVEGKYSNWIKDNRILISDDYFETEAEAPLEPGRTVSGIVNLAAVKGYFAVAAKSEGTSEMALYVTDDTSVWHRAEFGQQTLEEDAYTILESTNYSIQVDVMTSGMTAPMGALFTSNSNGTYFTENIKHTNRNMRGFVDFEKIQNIQGIVLVNQVSNWQDIEKSWLADKELVTRISFDDGRTWQPLMVKDDELHLHSVTRQRNSGRIFSSPAPGIIMGVGNTGDFLKEWEAGDTYISDDAGLTWSRTLKGPHLYEMGDQGAIVVAVEDAETDEVKWSINHGKDWETTKLDDKVRALTLQTVPGSTSLKFIMTVSRGGASSMKYSTIALDFEELHEGKCKESDFEKWPARVDKKGEPSCLMGHKTFFRRRKPSADCFVEEDFKDPQPEFEDCLCTDEDYECDYNFVKSEDGKECIPAGPIKAPKDVCKGDDETFEGSSGYRLIPGNTCIRKGGVIKDEPIKRPCKDTEKKPASGMVSHERTPFPRAKSVKEYYYLERAELAQGDDETIIMRTDNRFTYITHDHGKTWTEVVPDEEIVAIYPHQYFNDYVYLITSSKRVYYSKNRGKQINSFTAPEAPNQNSVQILAFHPEEKDWLIWTGGKECGFFDFSGDCHSVAHVSTKGGEEWTTLLPYVRKCQFVSREDRKDSEKLVYCEQYADEDPKNGLQLVSSNDWFEHKTSHFKDVISFATMQEFIIVALRDTDQETLRVDASVDGVTFANAQFPSNFKVPHQKAYTVLDSSTHSVFLHVTVNNRPEQEYGSIIKSNSNGTSYVLSITHVNRNTPGYVDFEKMQGLEGVAVVNVVSNPQEVDGGASKKLQTMITHNDGAEWQLITPPAQDSDKKSFDCKDSILEKCSLHLHGYTERKDPRDTFSSATAVGMMLGVGNVGPNLVPYKEGDTFITRDGGITWHEVFKGTYMWEFGDQGSVIVIVKEGEPVKQVYYSRDEGSTWQAYEFSKTPMLIDDISTVPSDTSRNFLLWGRDEGNLVTINLDFTGLTDRKCELDDEHPDDPKNDYFLWSPKHPLSDDDCLFGHVSEYHRKKPEADCYVGVRRDVVHLHNVARNCSCTRQDFECDYNYERQRDGSCALVPGLSPPDHQAVCSLDQNAVEWYEPTGYRRIPLTTCQGGKEMDYTAQKHPCPGKEVEYEKKNGISGVGLFFAIVIPIAAAAAVGYWVWRNWDGKFGRIQLGDGMGMGGAGGAFDGESPLVKIPIAVLSGLVAVAGALPVLAGSAWRAVSGRFGRGGGGGYTRPYTSRSSFQRTRGDYAAVEDEGELLGDESDEEV